MTLQLTIPKLACSACVTTITQAIHTVDPTATVQADTQTRQVHVQTQASTTAIKDAIAAAGYPAN